MIIKISNANLGQSVFRVKLLTDKKILTRHKFVSHKHFLKSNYRIPSKHARKIEMMKKLSLRLLLFFILVSTAGCSGRKAILNEVYQKDGIILNGIVTSIEIIDFNDASLGNYPKNPSSLSLHTSFNSSIGVYNQYSFKESISNPPLSNTQRENMENQIRTYFQGNKEIYSVKCFILAGITSFKGGFFWETEKAKITMKMQVFSVNDTMIHETITVAELKTHPQNVSKKKLSSLYTKAIELAINQCFRSINK